MPPKRSLADKLKKPLLLLAVILFFGSGTLYFYIKGETKAPGFGSQADLYEVAGAEFHFIDVGQGDCTLLLCGENAVLIDGGEAENGEKILSYLQQHGVQKLDLMIASHRHADHIGSFGFLLEHFTVSEVLLNRQDASSDADVFSQTQLLQAAENTDVPVRIADTDTVYTFGELTLEVLSAGSTVSEENEQSLVILASYEDKKVLFTGDIGAASEKELLAEKVLCDVDVLKVAHHGSNYSNTDDFLRVTNPEYAVISCGEQNDYGHPGEQTLDRLQRAGCKICRTDLNATVVLTCHAGKIHILTKEKE